MYFMRHVFCVKMVFGTRSNPVHTNSDNHLVQSIRPMGVHEKYFYNWYCLSKINHAPMWEITRIGKEVFSCTVNCFIRTSFHLVTRAVGGSFAKSNVCLKEKKTVVKTTTNPKQSQEYW